MLVLFFFVAMASAHGYIERTEPADGDELASSPTEIKVWFSEPLVPETGKISIINGNGESIAPLSVVHNPDDNTLLIAELPPNLPNNTYIINASATVVSDGHTPSNSIVFWVGERIDAVATSESTPRPAYELLALFFGAFAVAMGGAYLWNRSANDELLPTYPTIQQDHFPLE